MKILPITKPTKLFTCDKMTITNDEMIKTFQNHYNCGSISKVATITKTIHHYARCMGINADTVTGTKVILRRLERLQDQQRKKRDFRPEDIFTGVFSFHFPCLVSQSRT